MPLLRLFIAFDTPAPVKTRALDLIATLRSANADVSWERGDKLHCTVKFLGETASERIPALRDALSAVGEQISPFPVVYRTVGCFPNTRAPRVLWIGIDDPSGTLHALYRSIEDALSPLAFERESRLFHPHLTLGRVRSPRNQGRLLETMETVTFASDPHTINSFSLMHSELRPSGSVYSEEKSYLLIGKR